MNFAQVPLQRSIATRLLKIIFTVYFMVTLVVTLTQLVSEYFHVKDSIEREIKVLQSTFGPGLVDAVWTFNRKLLQSILVGMEQITIVKGVKIENEKGQEIRAIGQILNEQGIREFVDREGHHQVENIDQGMLNELFGFAFELKYVDENGDAKKVGKATVYSGVEVVVERVRYGFILVIVNSVIKTFALWFIFLAVVRHWLGKPLQQLTQSISNISTDSLQTLPIRSGPRQQDELTLLEDSFNQMLLRLGKAQIELKELNASLEHKVQDRTKALENSYHELEQQNLTLTASNRKLGEVNHLKDNLLRKLDGLYEEELQAARNACRSAQANEPQVAHQALVEIDKLLYRLDDAIRPIKTLYYEEQAIRSKRVLLAEPNRKQQILAKMSLGGTGVDLDIVTSVEESRAALQKNVYDVICVCPTLLESMNYAVEHHPHTQFVLMTPDDAAENIQTLKKYPFLSSIVSRREDDRSFNSKSMLITVSKLLNHDLFGLWKYLSWGVDISEHDVTHSDQREELIQEMVQEFTRLGVRNKIIRNSETIAEELLMNAIYDAPRDEKGVELYNHLPRTELIHLKPNEQAKFSYACDGVFLAIAIEDPFGGLSRKTILDYLESCYTGKAGSLNKAKGGGGRGLFLIMEMVDLLVINVKPKFKTEIIALFYLEDGASQQTKSTSLHYFSE